MSVEKSAFVSAHCSIMHPALELPLSIQIVVVDNFVFGCIRAPSVSVYAHVEYLVKSLIKAFPGGRNRSRVGLVPRNPH